MNLEAILHARVRRAELWEPLDARRIRCVACGHRCPIFEGQSGVCKVRFNKGGTLYAPWGYTAALQCDPIEKKPFFHLVPGALAFSFGMLGCDLHCGYCQNWVTSQALRDPVAVSLPRSITPEQIVDSACESGAGFVVSTYNEPLITAEWAAAVFREARAKGLRTAFVSNGNATPEVLEYLRPWLDAFKIDLKSLSDRQYRTLGGRLQPILDSVRLAYEMGYWVEVVTLVVPGFNDTADELGDMAEFIASVSPDIPWHVTAFHADYKMDDVRDTSPETLLRAIEIGRTSGLRYVYGGNLPGTPQDTRCPACDRVLVERRGFRVRANLLSPDGVCPGCGLRVPGIWA